MRKPTRQIDALLEQRGPALHALLYRLTLRVDVAEDLMQELFVRLSRSPGFERARDPAAFAARAAINLAMDWRRHRRRHPLPLPLEIEPTTKEDSPLNRMIEAEETQAMLDALGQLPELSREAFVLRFIEGEPYDLVARRLGRTAHQARALCHKAVHGLQNLLRSREVVRDAPR